MGLSIMAIVQTLHTATQFVDAFKQSSRGEQFSYEALEAIFQYFEDRGDNVEFDPVGICCDFAESHYIDIAETYSIDLNQWFTKEERIEAVRDFIENETWSYVLSDGETIVYIQF